MADLEMIKSNIKSVIVGTGSYLPSNLVTNANLVERMDTSEGWILSRTGVSQRHIANDQETPAVMATMAANKALEMAGLTGDDIDLVIVGTVSGDLSFPSVACFVQKEIGMVNKGSAFDIQAACSGFIYALHLADTQIKLGIVKRALIIGAEKMSSYIDWEDRSTAVLFGDGAGAVIIEASSNTNYGVIGTKTCADGSKAGFLKSTGGPSLTGTIGNIAMDGKEVFRNAVEYMASVTADLLKEHSVKVSDVDWLVPHQANLRIIEAVAKKMQIPKDKAILTVQDHANTSAASIPLALDIANRRGLFKQGDILAICAFGAGFTWASALIRWQTT